MTQNETQQTYQVNFNYGDIEGNLTDPKLIAFYCNLGLQVAKINEFPISEFSENSNPLSEYKLFCESQNEQLAININSTIQEQILTLTSKIDELSRKASGEDVDKISEYQLVNNLLEEKLKTNIQLTLQEYISIITDKVDELIKKDLDENTETPSIIGQEGEQYVKDILEESYCVERILSRTGDFLINKITENDKLIGPIMVEVKKYQTIVPTREVQKYENDLQSNPQVRAGLFISLTCPIAKFKDSIIIKKQNMNGRIVQCIYLHSSDKNIIKMCVELLFLYLKNDNRALSKLEYKIKEINELCAVIKMMGDDILETRTFLDNKLIKLHEESAFIHNKISLLAKSITSDIVQTSEIIISDRVKLFDTINSKINVDVAGDIYKNMFIDLLNLMVNDEFTIEVSGSEIVVNGIIKFMLKINKLYISLKFSTTLLDFIDEKKYRGMYSIDKKGNVCLDINFSKTGIKKKIAHLDRMKDIMELITVGASV